MRNNIINTSAIIIGLLSLGAGLTVMIGGGAFAYLVLVIVQSGI